ncbi:MAG: ribonuclease III [Gammaproteobacteria bacterium]
MELGLEKLARRLGHRFGDFSLLTDSLTHRSVSVGHNNERLEFLGDAILNCIISDELYRRFPLASEGQLTRLRATLVKGETLAELAIELDICDFLRLGVGELKSGGAKRPSILADALEAIIAAIYIDGGMDTCRSLVIEWFAKRLDSSSLDKIKKDPKTLLQEHLQAHKFNLPEYTISAINGEAHQQYFSVSCVIADLNVTTTGEGISRRKAEQDAAEKALQQLVKKL